mmetsp:Transcript_23663/g.55130  ORF Transcript_23663/g.55130 Transcript_23663/m.55130 type:complete len:140 (-) Transcript_23663:108-527(-)
MVNRFENTTRKSIEVRKQSSSCIVAEFCIVLQYCISILLVAPLCLTTNLCAVIFYGFFSLSENERATSPSFLNLRMTRIENMMDEESRNNNADTNQQNVEFTLFLERFLQDTLSDDSEVMKNEPLFVGDFPLDDLFDDI